MTDDHPWPWALDAARRRYRVGDLVVTSKRCWFGPGIVGEVVALTRDSVSVATDLTVRGRVTVRHYHVLVVERRTGLRVRLRRAWQHAKEMRNT